MDTLRLKKNENIYVSEALRIDPSKYNLVELRTAEDGENLRNLSGVSLCFGEAEAYGICLEAEYAELSGSAYKSGAYVAGIDDTGSSLHFPSIRIPSAGVWTVRVYYAAAAGIPFMRQDFRSLAETAVKMLQDQLQGMPVSNSFVPYIFNRS